MQQTTMFVEYLFLEITRTIATMVIMTMSKVLMMVLMPMFNDDSDDINYDEKDDDFDDTRLYKLVLTSLSFSLSLYIYLYYFFTFYA
mmetsp:Transcript_13512/g.23885  ORF Transcript_13512/g.23885 Transcript_13512/m.23885 type:complete len:87 (-) Transcript_13512:148-408(-)